MACDICGENKATLVPIRENFETDEVKQICPACEADIIQQDRKLKKLTDKIRINWIRRFIINRRKKSENFTAG